MRTMKARPITRDLRPTTSPDVVLRPGRWKWMACFLFSTAAACLPLVARASKQTPHWPAYLWIATLGLCAVVCGSVVIVPNSAFLRLDSDGFTARSLFRTYHLAWRDVHNFGPTRLGLNNMSVGAGIEPSPANEPILSAAVSA